MIPSYQSQLPMIGDVVSDILAELLVGLLLFEDPRKVHAAGCEGYYIPNSTLQLMRRCFPS